MTASTAHKPREDFDKSDIERIADGVIATAENFRDSKISAHAAHRASLHFIDMLHAIDGNQERLPRRARLLAFLIYEWALEVENGGDFADVRECLNLASRMVLIVQTTMAREAGRMP